MKNIYAGSYEVREAALVLVCGGRNFHDWELLSLTLEHIWNTRGISLLIHGCAAGADMMADRWASENGIQPVVCRALWDFWKARKNLKAAGPIRNTSMLRLKPTLVVAFPGGDGTADMVRKARAAGIEVMEVESYA